MMNPELLIRYCKGLCTPEEKREVEEQARQSEALRNDIRQLRLSMTLVEDIREMERIDTPAAYERTRRKLRTERRKTWQMRLMRYAAFLALPLFIATLVLGYLHFEKPEADLRYTEIKTQPGTITRYEMPDRSIVWLNGGTTLRYPATFDSRHRQVKLEGEAYFEVTADPKHPFYVDTPDGLTVYVYGTRFNVSAYAEDARIEAVLEKGKVNIITPDNKAELPLNPGEMLTYDKQTKRSVKKAIDPYEKVAWKEGKLIFRNAPLDEVLRKLARHYNAYIEFHNLSKKEYKYRATFRNESLEQILDYLSKSAHIEWSIEPQELKADGTLTRDKIIVELH